MLVDLLSSISLILTTLVVWVVDKHMLKSEKARIVVGTASEAVCVFFLIGDCIFNHHKECRYIWKKTSWRVPHYLYLFSRYFGILSQIASLIFTTTLLAPSTPERICRAWLVVLIGPFHLLILVLELVLVLRAYALYNRSKWIGGILCSMWGAEVSMILYHWRSVAKALTFSSACGLGGSPPELAIPASAAMLTTHLLIWSMTAVKSWPLRSLPRASKLIMTVVRDGAVTLLAFLAPCLLTTVVSIIYKPPAIEFIAVPFIASICSLGTCRLILNMQIIVDENETSPHELTTCFTATDVRFDASYITFIH